MRIPRNNFAIFRKKSALCQEKISTSQEKKSALCQEKFSTSQEKIVLHNRHRTHNFPANFLDFDMLPTKKKCSGPLDLASPGMVPAIKPESNPELRFKPALLHPGHGLKSYGFQNMRPNKGPDAAGRHTQSQVP